MVTMNNAPIDAQFVAASRKVSSVSQIRSKEVESMFTRTRPDCATEGNSPMRLLPPTTWDQLELQRARLLSTFIEIYFSADAPERNR